jgi:hypothetical protein
MSNTESLIALYRALDWQHELNPDNPADQRLYAPGLHSQGGLSPVDELRANIEMAVRPGTWLFTGHRGVGKSTELLRMAHELRSTGRYYAVVADMEKRLNLAEPIKIESLLVGLAAAFADQVDHDFGANRANGHYAGRLWEWLTKTEINLTKLDLKLGDAGFTAQLRENPSFRAEVQAALESSRGTWFEQVKQFIKETTADVRLQRGEATQVIIVLDSLERLRVSGNNAQSCYEAIVQTFDGNGQYLKLDGVHVVYSVPPFLPFLVPRIGTYFGVEVCKLPHVKVFNTPDLSQGAQAVTPNAVGIDGMVGIIAKRFPKVEQLIPKAQLQRMALASSGSVRDLFRLVKSVCAKAQVTKPVFPLQDESLVQLAEQVLRDEMPMADDDLKRLARVRVSHGVALDSMDNLHKVARLFDSGVVLAYRNGVGDWCEAQYLLHDQVEPFLAGVLPPGAAKAAG